MVCVCVRVWGLCAECGAFALNKCRCLCAAMFRQGLGRHRYDSGPSRASQERSGVGVTLQERGERGRG